MAGSTVCTPTPFNTALLATTVVFVCLATFAILLRLLATYNADGRAWYRADTWLLITSLALCYGFMIQTICGCAITGVNCYRSDVDKTWAEHEVMKILWTDLFLLTPASALVKVSVLEYYKRIFLTRRCQWICNIMIALCSAWAISTIFAQAFSSTPISKSWNPKVTANDLNYDYTAFTLATVSINVILDFTVLYLPLPFLIQLHMPALRLAKICVIFTLGSFCLICAIVRLYYADRQTSDIGEDPHYRARIVGLTAMWGRMEPPACIIAACLPTFGPLICSRCSIFNVLTPGSSRNNSKDISAGDFQGIKVNRASHASITRHHAFDDPHFPHHHVSIHSTSRPTSRVAVPGQISVEYDFCVNSERSTLSGTSTIAEAQSNEEQ